MQVIQTTKDSASALFTEAELILLNNVLNEVLHGINISEFETRLGASRLEAEELLHQINSLLSKMR